MKEIMWNIRKITFTTIDDVYENKEKFRDEVLLLDQDTLEIYKWYFYHQLCLMAHKRQFLKDLMWEYLVLVIASKGLPHILVFLVFTSQKTRVFLSTAMISISQKREKCLFISRIL